MFLKDYPIILIHGTPMNKIIFDSVLYYSRKNINVIFCQEKHLLKIYHKTNILFSKSETSSFGLVGFKIGGLQDFYNGVFLKVSLEPLQIF